MPEGVYACSCASRHCKPRAAARRLQTRRALQEVLAMVGVHGFGRSGAALALVAAAACSSEDAGSPGEPYAAGGSAAGAAAAGGSGAVAAAAGSAGVAGGAGGLAGTAGAPAGSAGTMPGTGGATPGTGGTTGGTGAAPSGGTAGASAEQCSGQACPSLDAVNLLLQQYALPTLSHCCTGDARCGGSYGKGDCTELDQPGTPDPACPGETISGYPQQGCCRPDGRCGLDLSLVKFGCVEREAAILGQLEPMACGASAGPDGG
jgi:hypothetical protein